MSNYTEHYEIEELACLVCGKSEEETNEIISNYDVDNMIYNKYDIDIDTYINIVQDLLPFTSPVETALTKEKYHAFINLKEGTIIVRRKING